MGTIVIPITGTFDVGQLDGRTTTAREDQDKDGNPATVKQTFEGELVRTDKDGNKLNVPDDSNV